MPGSSARRSKGSSSMRSAGIRVATVAGASTKNYAVAASFFKTLRRELVKERRYEAREEAKQDIFKCIELCCNRVRMHSYPGYMSPDEYERKCA
ncbi:IS3 family transposase [Slackia exigua]|uniref:IS3 family transposase n=1 Tax=Slackia exigua TaxID=84109 RepID=UPI003D0117E1